MYVYVTRAFGVPVKVIGVVLFKQIVAAPAILAVGKAFTSMEVVAGCKFKHPFASRTLTSVYVLMPAPLVGTCNLASLETPWVFKVSVEPFKV